MFHFWNKTYCAKGRHLFGVWKSVNKDSKDGIIFSVECLEGRVLCLDVKLLLSPLAIENY